MYKFPSIFEAHSMGYSGFMVQSTEDAEYIISCIFVFQTFCPALAEASSLLKNILKLRTGNEWSLLSRGDI